LKRSLKTKMFLLILLLILAGVLSGCASIPIPNAIPIPNPFLLMGLL